MQDFSKRLIGKNLIKNMVLNRNYKGAFVKGHKINIGKKCSAITKKKIGEANKIALKKYYECRSSWNKGKKMSDDHIRKLKESHIGKPHLWNRGSKCPTWKGGITPENVSIRHGIEFRLWREAVFARDNWTCQKYKIKGGKLHPHHVKNFSEYPELRFAINNGLTLSEKAHKEFHKKYGTKNNNFNQIKEFLNL